MKVLDHYRPEKGVLALLLSCPGRRCVVTLRGRRGSPPRAWPCPTHEPPPPQGVNCRCVLAPVLRIPTLEELRAVLSLPDAERSRLAARIIGEGIRARRSRARA